MFPGILPKDKGFIVQQNNPAGNGKRRNKTALSNASSQSGSIVSDRSKVHVKNYNFTLPSVAVWQDLNELEATRDPIAKNPPKRRNRNKIKKSYAEEFILPQETEEHDKMRRNKGVKKEGSFVHPSEFTLNRSVIVPMSRAGIRLQPLRNAPVPNIEDKHDGVILTSTVREKTKVFLLPEKSMIIDKIHIDKPNRKESSEFREHTELLPEPTFVLEENYKSDGELDVMELSDTDDPKISPENRDEFEEGLFPEIELTTQKENKTGDDAKISDKNSELAKNDGLSLPLINKTEPPKESVTVNRNKMTSDVRLSLPVYKLSQDTKKTARYSLKNRSTVSKRILNAENKRTDKFANRKKSINNNSRRTFPGNEFVVGNARPARPKFSEKHQKRNVPDKKVIVIQKEKQDVPWNIEKKLKGNDTKEILPRINDQASVVESATEEESGIGSQEMEVECDVEIMNISEEIEPEIEEPKNPSTSAEESMRNTSRAKSPKVLEYPLHLMAKSKKDFIQRKREEFRKIDIDGDGHLSLFELLKCFPKTLSRQQVDYLKMIYQKACNSTFFGLEEYLCVDEMCKGMVDMGDVLVSVYSRLDLRSVQENLDPFLVKFAEAYQSSNGLAVFKNLLDHGDCSRASSSIKQVVQSFQEQGKDLSLGIGKADFLLLVPVFVADGWQPKDLSI